MRMLPSTGRWPFSGLFGKPGKGSSTRALGLEEARKLKAGGDHYRSYVGPPSRFDFMSATQFALLFVMGLKETDRVLDIGCGSLRLGRLLIPFLLAERYFGVEPNDWLVEEGIKRELGRDAVRLKKPVFSSREDYEFGGLGQRFDFVVAQSIATHCGPDQLARLFAGASAVLGDEGRFLLTFTQGDDAKLPANGWHYPQTVDYNLDTILNCLTEAGLCGVAIPWFHPGNAKWVVAARDASILPSDRDMTALAGTVLPRAPSPSGRASGT